MLIEKTTSFSGFAIPEEGLTVPEGRSLIMTVDGVVMTPNPGRYEGEVVLNVVEAMPKIGKCEMESLFNRGKPELTSYTHPYRAALVVDEKVIPEKSALSAVVDAKITDEGIEGGTITAKDDFFNGIMVLDGDYRISGTKLNMDGRGGDDFELFGAGIACAGNSKVVIDRVDVETRGCINSTIAAAERCTLLVENSHFVSHGGSNEGLYGNMLTETPWVLGLRGTIRTTNILGESHATFYNCAGESSGWGVYSTDDFNNGWHILVNSSALIRRDSEYGSGYGAYVLSNANSRFLGVDFDTPTYGLAFHGQSNDIYVGPSSRDNLLRHLGPKSLLYKETHGFADVEERASRFRSGHNCFYWHGGDMEKPGTLYIEPGTELSAGEAVFLVKAGEDSMAKAHGGIGYGVNPTVNVKGAKLDSDVGVILHFMESDDPGLGTSGHDKHWAESYTVLEPRLTPFEGHDRASESTRGVMHAFFTDMEMRGDIINSVFTCPQNLVVTLHNVKYTGMVTTGVQRHRNVKPGEKITEDNREELGNVTCTPAPDYPCGLILKLESGTVWTPAATGYLSRLVIGDGCAVEAPAGKTLKLVVNGEEKAPAPGEYVGDIHVVVE